MARLWSSGFELNSLTAGMEFLGSSGSPSIQSTTKRSGSYALQISSLSSGVRKHVQLPLYAGVANTSGPYYVRFYLYVVTLPSADNRIYVLSNSSGFNMRAAVTLSSTGTLQLADEDGNIGSPSSALSTNTWYMIEMLFDTFAAAGSHVVKARLNGVEFAAATNRSISSGIATMFAGGNLALEAQTQGEWYFDDIAVNDSTGSFQNSYPDSGKVIHLRPSAAGDSAGWVRQGTDSGANWSQVSEVTPDDITQYVNTTTLNAEDLYEVDNSGIGASDTVNVVQVGVRFRGNNATSVPTFVVEIEKASGGTKSQSSGITPASTTWLTNSTANNVLTHPLTLHQDPDSSNWTQATLDTMQIGMKLTVDNTNRDDVSTIWALVDYTPSVTSAALTGTITASATEADIVAGGKTIILTLTGDTWVASGATFDAQRQNIINGLDSAQAEANGWDAVVKAGLAVTDVVRTSATVVTITLPAFATYNITATETVTATIPSTALTGGVQIVASPTFTVSAVSVGATNQNLMMMGIG